MVDDAKWLDFERVARGALHRVAVGQVRAGRLLRPGRRLRGSSETAAPHHFGRQLNLDGRHGLQLGQEELFERAGHQTDVLFRLVVAVTVFEHQVDVVDTFFGAPEG